MALVWRAAVEVKRERRRARSVVVLWHIISFALDAVMRLACSLYHWGDNDCCMVWSSTTAALALSATMCFSYHNRSPPSVSIHSQSDGIGINLCGLPSCSSSSILSSRTVAFNTLKCAALHSCFCCWHCRLAWRSQAAWIVHFASSQGPLSGHAVWQ